MTTAQAAPKQWSVGGLSVGPTDYAAFFDASGSPDDCRPNPALFVSGLVASPSKCRRFEAEWAALLDCYEIEPPFHRTEFEYGKGQYARFRADPVLHDSFINDAITVIQHNSNKPLSMGVVINDLVRIYADWDLPVEWPREPYAYCGGRAIGLARIWAQRRLERGDAHPFSKLIVVFEKGDKNQGRLTEAAKHFYDLEPLFLSKTECMQFQACDLIAWEHRRYLSDRISQKPIRVRDSLVEISRRLPMDGCKFSDYDSLVKDCVQFGYPKRP